MVESSRPTNSNSGVLPNITKKVGQVRPSSLFFRVFKVLKLANLANFNQVHSFCRFVRCGRVFEARQNNLKIGKCKDF